MALFSNCGEAATLKGPWRTLDYVTNDERTNFRQKSSLEPSAQMSYKRMSPAGTKPHQYKKCEGPISGESSIGSWEGEGG